jgi:hypothetical protein
MKVLLRFHLAIILSCAAAQPKELAAHSSDVLLVRLVLNEPPQVTLEVTADLNGIPWLGTASNPAELLGKTLKINAPSGRSWYASEMGQPRVSLHSGYPHPAPVPLTHSSEETVPELYTVAWTWRPSETPLQLEITNDRPVTSFIWAVSQKTNLPMPGWQPLVEGERSKPIALPFTPSPLQWSWKAYTAAGISACGLILQGCLITIRWRRMRKTAALLK